MDLSIKEWRKLSCDCGSIEFSPTVELYWKDGQGTTPKPKGYVCTKCSKVTDISRLSNKAKELDIQKRIEELQAEQHG